MKESDGNFAAMHYVKEFNTADPVHIVLRRVALFRLLLTEYCGEPISIALLDGVINCSHPCFAQAYIDQRITDLVSESPSEHATFIASMLVGSGPWIIGINPYARLISIPIVDAAFKAGNLPARIAAQRISEAIRFAVLEGAQVIQLSMEFVPHADYAFGKVAVSIDWAVRRGVRTVIAAGNNPTLGSSYVLCGKGTVPVAMADNYDLPHPLNPLGRSIGANGLLAPGTNLPGAAVSGGICTASGTSLAASFVTGAYTLLRAKFPKLRSFEIWHSLLRYSGRAPISIIPPLLNVGASMVECEKKERMRQ